MNLRRIVADLIDPGRLVEVRELRDTTYQAEMRRQNAEALLIRSRVDRTAELAVTDALWRAECDENRKLRADVARLLEAAACCAHEHNDI